MTLQRHGIKIYLMHGNRDLLMGDELGTGLPVQPCWTTRPCSTCMAHPR